VQLGFEYPTPQTHGGARAGAGRPKGARPRVAHRKRERIRKGEVVHVTLRLRPEASGVRRRRQYAVIRAVMRRWGHRDDFAINQYSIQGNHLHLVCEPLDRDALARGIQGFSSMIARRLNALCGRRGSVFADRYHVRILRTPREVRHVLCYVINNWRKHGVHERHRAWTIDPYSSGWFFDGWKDWRPPRQDFLDADEPIPIAPARSWLLRVGWRKHGLIAPTEAPRSRL